jgi:hypothetical protein
MLQHMLLLFLFKPKNLILHLKLLQELVLKIQQSSITTKCIKMLKSTNTKSKSAEAVLDLNRSWVHDKETINSMMEMNETHIFVQIKKHIQIIVI